MVSTRNEWVRFGAVAALYVIVALVTYRTGLAGRFFADDFQFRMTGLAGSPLWFFTHVNPANQYAYRPLEAAFLWVMQTAFGDSTLPVHLSNLLLHAFLAAGMYAFLVRIGFSVREAVLASAYLLVSQAGAHAVMSNDTSSQIFGTITGYASLCALHLFLIRPSNGKKKRLGLYALSVALYAVALLSKETSLSFFVLISVLLAYRAYQERNAAGAVMRVLPFAALTLAYFAMRHHLGLTGAHIGSGPMEFALGSNVIINTAMAVFQAALSGSSVAVLEAVKTRHFTSQLLPVALTGAMFAAVLGGYVMSRRRDLFFALGFVMVASLSVVIVMNHISELYVYNALPAYAVFMAVGFNGLLEHLRARPLKMALAAMLALVFILNIMANWQKGELMRDQGEQAASIVPQVVAFARLQPPNAEVNLVNRSRAFEYSIFRRSEFHAITDGLMEIQRQSGRYDIRVRCIRDDSVALFRAPNSVFLYLQPGGRVALFDPMR